MTLYFIHTKKCSCNKRKYNKDNIFVEKKQFNNKIFKKVFESSKNLLLLSTEKFVKSLPSKHEFNRIILIQ